MPMVPSGIWRTRSCSLRRESICRTGTRGTPQSPNRAVQRTRPVAGPAGGIEGCARWAGPLSLALCDVRPMAYRRADASGPESPRWRLVHRTLFSECGIPAEGADSDRRWAYLLLHGTDEPGTG